MYITGMMVLYMLRKDEKREHQDGVQRKANRKIHDARHFK